MKDYSLEEFLGKLSNAFGDEAIDLISDFQEGSITVHGIHCRDFDVNEDEDND